MTDMIIDLTQSQDAGELSGHENIVQASAMDRIYEIFKDRLMTAEKELANFDKNLQEKPKLETSYKRSHSTILIDGKRGTGKTTFLINVLKNPTAEQKKSTDQIYELALIDPTLIETREHFLVIIIALVKKAITDDSRTEHESKHDKWCEALLDLAGGLTQIDGIGEDRPYDDQWEDRHYVLEKGLSKALGGVGFEQKFNLFLYYSLRLLKKKSFLLRFDDIDTRFERGWPVLESIRKYLTSPFLIVMLSGDLTLFSQLVRSRQYEALGEQLMKFDRPSREYHQESGLRNWRDDKLIHDVGNLEDQYLLKIIKPEYRVPIKTIAEIVDGEEKKLVLKLDDGHEMKKLDDVMDIILRKVIGINEPPVLEAYRNAFLRQPMRTFINLVHPFKPFISENTGTTENRQISPSIAQVFSGALLRAEINPDSFRPNDSSLSALCYQLSLWANKLDIWEDAFRLIPDLANSDDNECAMTFGIHFGEVINKNPSAGFMFMIKSSLLRETGTLIRPDRRLDLIRYSRVGTQEPAVEVIRRLISSLRFPDVHSSARTEDTRHQRGIYAGTIYTSDRPRLELELMSRSLYGWTKPSNSKLTIAKSLQAQIKKNDFATITHHPYLGNWWREIQKSLNNKDSKNRINMYDTRMLGITYNTFESIPRYFEKNGYFSRILLTSVREVTKRERRTYASIYNIIAALADLLESTHDDVSKTKTHRWLEGLARLNTVPAPPWLEERFLYTEAKKEEDDAETEENDNDTTSGFDESSLISALDLWCSKVRDEWTSISLPAQFFGNVMSRLFNALDRMDDGLIHKRHYHSLYLGNLLHRQIVIFLNAILIEEAQLKGQTSRLSRQTNPTNDDRVFIENVQGTGRSPIKITLESEICEFSLFRLLMACPLIGLFLQPETFDKDYRLEEAPAFTFHKQAWRGLCGEKVSIEDALKTKSKFLGVEFPNLWAVLNTVPVIDPNIVIKNVFKANPETGKQNIKSNDDSEDDT
mgnify:CR=1 FL=1